MFGTSWSKTLFEQDLESSQSFSSVPCVCDYRIESSMGIGPGWDHRRGFCPSTDTSTIPLRRGIGLGCQWERGRSKG